MPYLILHLVIAMDKSGITLLFLGEAIYPLITNLDDFIGSLKLVYVLKQQLLNKFIIWNCNQIFFSKDTFQMTNETVWLVLIFIKK